MLVDVEWKTESSFLKSVYTPNNRRVNLKKITELGVFKIFRKFWFQNGPTGTCVARLFREEIKKRDTKSQSQSHSKFDVIKKKQTSNCGVKQKEQRSGKIECCSFIFIADRSSDSHWSTYDNLVPGLFPKNKKWTDRMHAQSFSH